MRQRPKALTAQHPKALKSQRPNIMSYLTKAQIHQKNKAAFLIFAAS